MEPLTHEESLLLFAVAVELAEQGDDESADRLEELANDPAKLRALIADAGDDGEGEPDPKP